MRVRDFNALSIEKQNEAVPSRRCEGIKQEHSRMSRSAQNLKHSAQILTGGNNISCQIANSVVNFGRELNSPNQSKAFTLAEVLITLVIIGVVAALTIPSMIVNYQKQSYVIRLKKTYNYLTNGFHQAMAKDGVTRLSDTTLWTKMPEGGLKYNNIYNNETKGAREEFLKIFSTAKIYDGTSTPSDMIVNYKALNSNTTTLPGRAHLFLNDGVDLQLNINKRLTYAKCGEVACKSLKEFQEYKHVQTKMWSSLGTINIDINGPQGPNTWGRDMYQFYISDDGNLYPFGGLDHAMMVKSCNFSDLSSCKQYWKSNAGKDYSCTTKSESHGQSCAARIMEEGWKMNY